MRLRPYLALPVLILFLIIPASASAVPQITAVTTPSGFTPAIYDATASSQASFTVAGTANFSGTVDIRCVSSLESTSYLLKSSVSITAGTFSTDITPAAATGLCSLHAVPGGTTPADLTNLTGPTITINDFELSTDNSVVEDFFGMFGQQSGLFDYSSSGDCGVADSYLVNPATGKISTQPMNCSALLARNADSSTLKIDGKNAFVSGQYTALSGEPGFNALTAAYSLDPTTGNVTITERQQLMTCPANAWEPDTGNCSPVQSLPVRLVRTITQDHDGLQSTVRDRYESTDGKAHTVSVGYIESVCLENGGCVSDASFKFPGNSAIENPNPGDQPVGPFADGSLIEISDAAKADGAVTSGRVGISTSPGSDSATFTFTHGFSLQFDNRAIPAGGAYTIVTRFSQAFLSSDLATLNSAPITGGGPADAPPSGGGGPNPPAPTPASATIGKSGSASAKFDKKKKVVKIAIGQSVSCPAGGGACKFSATLSTKYKRGKKSKTYEQQTDSITVPAGTSTPVVFTLKKNNPLYTPKGSEGSNPLYDIKQKFSGVITATTPGAPPTTAKFTLKLKLPKIPKK